MFFFSNVTLSNFVTSGVVQRAPGEEIVEGDDSDRDPNILVSKDDRQQEREDLREEMGGGSGEEEHVGPTKKQPQRRRQGRAKNKE